MKKELGIARCGLACCLCSENGRCGGCDSGDCPGAGNCENRTCSISRRLRHCYECPDVENCRKGKLSDPRTYGFTHFARQNWTFFIFKTAYCDFYLCKG